MENNVTELQVLAIMYVYIHSGNLQRNCAQELWYLPTPIGVIQCLQKCT